MALAALLTLSWAVLGLLAPGAQAGDCKGQRQVLREAPGFVTDGAGNYSVNGNCEWLIEGEWGSAGCKPTDPFICTPVLPLAPCPAQFPRAPFSPCLLL